jgi:hypothetical protein
MHAYTYTFMRYRHACIHTLMTYIHTCIQVLNLVEDRKLAAAGDLVVFRIDGVKEGEKYV